MKRTWPIYGVRYIHNRMLQPYFSDLCQYRPLRKVLSKQIEGRNTHEQTIF